MSSTRPSPRDDATGIYCIRVQGRLGPGWAPWFDGLTLHVEADSPPITTLTGPVADQAALRGILNRLWDLNLSLVSVTREPSHGKYEQRGTQHE